MNKLQEACIISHEHWLNEIEQSIASIDIDIPEIKSIVNLATLVGLDKPIFFGTNSPNTNVK